ncbi:MAG: hypothetical protein WKF47_00275 [Geodermatophilaceae bacterium]
MAAGRPRPRCRRRCVGPATLGLAADHAHRDEPTATSPVTASTTAGPAGTTAPTQPGTDLDGTDPDGTIAGGTDGLGTDGLGTDGLDTDGLGTDGLGTDGLDTDGLGTDGLDTDGRAGHSQQ